MPTTGEPPTSLGGSPSEHIGAAGADDPRVQPADSVVTVGPIAHGGHCVARLGDRVVFVRHALPGEQVRIVMTDDRQPRFWRADAVEVLEPSPARVPPPCPVSGPGGCGGCDFQHVDVAAQRELKAQVVAEQLRRLAGIEWSVEVEAAAGRPDGLGWRTRMRYRVDDSGVAGFRAHRSHRVVPLPEDGCPIADPETPTVAGREWPAGAELTAVRAASGGVTLVEGTAFEGNAEVVEEAAGREWAVAAGGFWQAHRAAPELLAGAVRDAVRPRPGERAFDLYCGVGLFAGVLADAGCRVWAVESNRAAVSMARRNLADMRGQVSVAAGRVEQALRRLPARADVVVLDPPRSGAGPAVMRQIIARAPRVIAYVACDPAALARDVAAAGRHGYQLTALRAFDLFPMTQHVECIASLTTAESNRP